MRRGLTIFAIWAAGLGAAAQFGKMSVAFPALEHVYSGHSAAGYAAHSAVAIGLLLSVVGMVGLVFGTTAGLIVARVGARRAMLAALVAGAALSALQSLTPPYAAMMLLRGLEGCSHLAIVVVGPTAIAAAAPPARQGAAMTLWSSFFGLTYAILAWIGPGILAGQGLHGLFLWHAGWMLAMAGVLWVLMPADPPRAPARAEGLLAGHVAIYRSPRVAAPATGFVCYTVTYVALLTLMPAAMGEVGALAAVAMPLVSIGLSLTFGVWLLGRISAVAQVQAGFALAAVAALALWPLWGSPWALAPALVLAGALGLVQGASFASIPQLNPLAEDRARAAGAVAQLGNLGTTTGTPLLAWALQQGGVGGLVAFTLGFSALGIAVHALQARRRVRAA